jgi:hypothetical protein
VFYGSDGRCRDNMAIAGAPAHRGMSRIDAATSATEQNAAGSSPNSQILTSQSGAAQHGAASAAEGASDKTMPAVLAAIHFALTGSLQVLAAFAAVVM